MGYVKGWGNWEIVELWDWLLKNWEIEVMGYVSRFLDDETFLRATIFNRMEDQLAKQIAMRNRTRDFAITVARLCSSFPGTMPGRHVAGQLIRCSTSVAANYRAACRARSKKEFVSKIGVVLEEADESQFWLEFARDLGLLTQSDPNRILSEANQLVAIFTATRATAQKNLNLTRTASRSIPKS
jgi:four helix bundle protein